MSGAGGKSGEREREGRGAGAERRAGVTKVGLSGERQIGRSRSAHMLWLQPYVLYTAALDLFIFLHVILGVTGD